MKKISFAAAAAFVAMTAMLTSCGNSKNTASTESVAASNVWTVDSVLANASSNVDGEITFEGVCTHACSHGATKIFLMGSDDTQTIRVEAAELGAFDPKCVNSVVTVKGLLREQRIDGAYLDEWERMYAEQSHGEDAEVGCESERAARGESADKSILDQIADYRVQIAQRDSTEGKPYLSFYYVDAVSYEIGE